MQKSFVSELPEETRSRIQALWYDGRASLDELVILAGGGISRSGLHRWLRSHTSDQAHIRGIRSKLLTLVADKTSNIHSAEGLSAVDLLQLSEALHHLDSIAVSGVSGERRRKHRISTLPTDDSASAQQG